MRDRTAILAVVAALSCTPAEVPTRTGGFLVVNTLDDPVELSLEMRGIDCTVAQALWATQPVYPEMAPSVVVPPGGIVDIIEPWTAPGDCALTGIITNSAVYGPAIGTVFLDRTRTTTLELPFDQPEAPEGTLVVRSTADGDIVLDGVITYTSPFADCPVIDTSGWGIAARVGELIDVRSSGPCTTFTLVDDETQDFEDQVCNLPFPFQVGDRIEITRPAGDTEILRPSDGLVVLGSVAGQSLPSGLDFTVAADVDAAVCGDADLLGVGYVDILGQSVQVGTSFVDGAYTLDVLAAGFSPITGAGSVTVILTNAP